MNIAIPIISTGVGAGLFFIIKILTQKKHPKKKHQKSTREKSDVQEYTQSEASDGESSSGYLTAAGDDVSDLPSLSIPRLVAAPMHEHSNRLFQNLRKILPLDFEIVPLRLFFPLTTETFMLLSLNPQLTEPILNGHPQTVYNQIVHPVKMILQNKSIKSYWFEALDSEAKDPFKKWTSPEYLEENFKEGADLRKTTHIVPLFLGYGEERFKDPFIVHNLVCKHFAHASKCLNKSPSSDPAPPPLPQKYKNSEGDVPLSTLILALEVV